MTMLAPPPKRARRAKALPPIDVVEEERLSEFYELLHAARFVVRCTASGRTLTRTEATEDERAVQSAMTGTPPVRRVAIVLTPPTTPPTRDDAELHLHVGMLSLLLVRPWRAGLATQLASEAHRYAERALAMHSGSAYDDVMGMARLEALLPDLAGRIHAGFAAVAEATTPGGLTLACCRLCDAADEVKALPYEVSRPEAVPTEIKPFVLP